MENAEGEKYWMEYFVPILFMLEIMFPHTVEDIVQQFKRDKVDPIHIKLVRDSEHSSHPSSGY
jgi:hypothetical protein